MWKEKQKQGICQRKRENNERFRQIWRIAREDIQENTKVGDTKDIAGRAARSDTSHQNVDEGGADSRKSGGQPESEENGEWIVGNMEEIKEEEGRDPRVSHAVRWWKAPAAWGADPSSGLKVIDVFSYVWFVRKLDFSKKKKRCRSTRRVG